MQKADQERLEAIWRECAADPGISPAEVARRLGIPRSSVTRALPNLESGGKLLSEDGRGKLWPFGRKK